jgi:hypothetical protein
MCRSRDDVRLPRSDLTVAAGTRIRPVSEGCAYRARRVGQLLPGIPLMHWFRACQYVLSGVLEESSSVE